MSDSNQREVVAIDREFLDRFFKALSELSIISERVRQIEATQKRLDEIVRDGAGEQPLVMQIHNLRADMRETKDAVTEIKQAIKEDRQKDRELSEERFQKEVDFANEMKKINYKGWWDWRLALTAVAGATLSHILSFFLK